MRKYKKQEERVLFDTIENTENMNIVLSKLLFFYNPQEDSARLVIVPSLFFFFFNTDFLKNLDF